MPVGGCGTSALQPDRLGVSDKRIYSPLRCGDPDFVARRAIDHQARSPRRRRPATVPGKATDDLAGLVITDTWSGHCTDPAQVLKILMHLVKTQRPHPGLDPTCLL